jgi:hypothetical protein
MDWFRPKELDVKFIIEEDDDIECFDSCYEWIQKIISKLKVNIKSKDYSNLRSTLGSSIIKFHNDTYKQRHKGNGKIDKIMSDLDNFGKSMSLPPVNFYSSAVKRVTFDIPNDLKLKFEIAEDSIIKFWCTIDS